MENQKMEIEISKSKLNLIFKNLINSLLITCVIFIVIQHFGIIDTVYYNQFYSPLGEVSSLHRDLGVKSSDYSYDEYRESSIKYIPKLFKVYIFDIIKHHKLKLALVSLVVFGALFFVSNLKSKYSIKIK